MVLLTDCLWVRAEYSGAGLAVRMVMILFLKMKNEEMDLILK
jgi:hypothetical protein